MRGLATKASNETSQLLPKLTSNVAKVRNELQRVMDDFQPFTYRWIANQSVMQSILSQLSTLGRIINAGCVVIPPLPLFGYKWDSQQNALLITLNEALPESIETTAGGLKYVLNHFELKYHHTIDSKPLFMEQIEEEKTDNQTTDQFNTSHMHHIRYNHFIRWVLCLSNRITFP